MKHRRIFTMVMGPIMATVIAVAPLSSFAQEKQDHDDGRTASAHVETQAKVKTDVKTDNGWLARLENWFRSPIAYAATLKNRAPVVTGVTAPTVLKVDQSGTWTVNAYDPENGSLSYAVDWGDMATGIMKAAAMPVFTQTSTFEHAYAAAGTYAVKFSIKDDAGNVTSTSVTVHVGPMANAPVISSLVGTSTRPTKARISWKTDTRADSSVWYGTTSPIDASLTPQVARLGRVTNHIVNLAKLSPDTTYYFVVRSRDNAGNSTFSSETSFKTPPAKPVASAPVITAVSGPSSLVTDEQGTWSLNAFDPQNGSIAYSVDWGDSPLMMRALLSTAEQPVFTQTATFSHSYASAGTYKVVFTAKDDAGLTTSTTTVVTVMEAPAATTTPPVASGIVLTPADSSISLDWTTDNPATSKVFYSTTSPVDTTSSSTTAHIDDNSLETKHSIDITGLATSTPYFLVIQSTDADQNSTTSSELSTSTLSGI